MSVLFFFLSLIATGLITLLGWHLRPDLRSGWLTIGVSTILCCLADRVMLAALPLLNLSFGPVGPPTIMLNLPRLGILAAALLALSLAHSSRDRKSIAALTILLQGIILALAFYGLYIEPFRLGVTELYLPQAPAFLPGRPLRILQLTDIHVEHPTRREQDMLAKANALQPDIIVLTGDYINASYLDDPNSLQETRQIISQLQAPYGVYAVKGDADKGSTMAAIFDGLTNVRVLDDEVLPLPFPGGTLYLVGVTVNGFYHDAEVLTQLMAKIPLNPYYVLLLYHKPDLAETASATGVDLYLAGHTHGGQIRLPFYGAIVTFSGYGKKYEMGDYLVGQTNLYVSRGIGMAGEWLPRARFLCPPEMVVVELGK